MTDMSLRFDTLKIAERLERGGFTHEQAKTQTEILATVVNTDVMDAATKEDIRTVNAELRAEIQEVKTELQAEIKAVENQVQALRIDTEGNFKLLRWMMGFILAMTSGLLYKLVIM